MVIEKWIKKQVYVVLILILQSSASLGSQTRVDIILNQSFGCVPLTVSFSASGVQGEGLTYLWRFGNGSQSSAVTPQTTYLTSGVYPITLSVSNLSGEVIYEGDTEVKVYGLPEVSFRLEGIEKGCAPFQTRFVNETEVTGHAYTWSFGDGTKSEEVSPQHEYERGGVYDVTLMVRSEEGCISSKTMIGMVSVYEPRARFWVTEPYSCGGELEAEFNNLSTGITPMSYEWDFGDGEKSTEVNPRHLYATSGVYDVSLKVRDTLGCESTTSTAGLITIVKTRADFTLSKAIVCRNEVFTLRSTSEYTKEYEWRYDDGTQDSYPVTYKAFSGSGNHEIWLIAKNGSCRDSIKKTIEVDGVTADFSVTADYLCSLPQTITYQNESTGAVSYQWQFGVGGTSNLKSPSVTYSELPEGKESVIYKDVLEVTSANGCKSRKAKADNIEIRIPKVRIWPGAGGDEKQLSGCIPMRVEFSDRTLYDSGKDAIEKRRWKLSDGSILEEESIVLNIRETGVYPVELMLTTTRGCLFEGEEKINAGEKQLVDFKVKGSGTVCATTPVDFEILSPTMSQITSVAWDFGDGDSLSMPFPPHYYIKTGKMDVSLTVYHYGCGTELTKGGLVDIKGPIARGTKQVNCAQPNEYKFVGELEGASSYRWDFGDGSTPIANEQEVIHGYSEKKNYQVRLEAWNTENGCSYTYHMPVTVTDVRSVIGKQVNKPCPNDAVTYEGSGSQDVIPFVHQGKTARYLWRHEESGKEIFSDAPVQFTFGTGGQHHVTLTVKDQNGCIDTSTDLQEIYQPQVSFTSAYVDGCMPVNYRFTDLSESKAELKQWQWDFGDGGISTTQHPVHGYGLYGKYSVMLRVTDAYGCEGQKRSEESVKVIEPNANFEALRPLLCEGMSTVFNAVSDSKIERYYWDFGNGETSQLSSPEVTYETSGMYDVSLEIVDDHDCRTQMTKSGYVSVQSYPRADFDSEDLVSNCYPYVVQFRDKSENATPGGWEWDFGENTNGSSLQHPFFIYQRPGKHDVRLVTSTSNGCRDTIIRENYIEVGGPMARIGVPDTVCRATELSFTMEEVQNVYDVRWEYGDGYTGTGDGAKHGYEMGGTVYPVMFLRADANNTCNKAIRDTLYVMEQRAVILFDEGSEKGCVPHGILLRDGSSYSENVIWDYGDGTTGDTKETVHEYAEAGHYRIKLQVSHRLGCKDSAEYDGIEVYPLPDVILSRDTTICAGDEARLRAGGGEAYEWKETEGGMVGSGSEVSVRPDNNQGYRVTVTDLHGCKSEKGVEVRVQHPVKLPVRDTSVIIGEIFESPWEDEGIGDYRWEPRDLVTNWDRSDAQVFVLKSQPLVLTVRDTTGCFTQQYPFELKIEEKYSVDLPSAFSPNGDGVNDKIYVSGWGIEDVVYFGIFNRLGQPVFETRDKGEGWDGTYQGVLQPSETYGYTVVVKRYGSGEQTKHGTIKLLR